MGSHHINNLNLEIPLYSSLLVKMKIVDMIEPFVASNTWKLWQWFLALWYDHCLPD